MKAAKSSDIHCEKRTHCWKHSHAHTHLQCVFVSVVHQSLLTDSSNQEPEMLSTSPCHNNCASQYRNGGNELKWLNERR